MIEISSEEIISHCGPTVYKRGQKCASFENFIGIFIQKNVIFGLYQGSVGTYKINIIFNNQNRPKHSWCTCPAMTQWDGPCKHIAALLILWSKAPAKFKVVDSWQSLFEKKDRTQLIDLITKVSAQSIDTTNLLYEETTGKALFELDEIYEHDNEWY